MPNLSKENLIYRTNLLFVLLNVLENEGISKEPLLRGTGIKLHNPSGPQAYVSTPQLLDVIRRAMAISPRRHLGLRFGQAVTMTNYGLYGLTMLSAPRLRDLFDFMTRHDAASDVIVRFAFSEGPAMAAISFHPSCDRHLESDLHVFLVEYALGACLSCGRELLGSEWPISAIEMTAAKPAASTVYGDTFGCPIEYGRPVDRIRFHPSLLDFVPKQGFAPTFALMQGLYEGQLDPSLPSPAIEARLQAIMMERGAGSVSIEQASGWLGMSSRTLRRRLTMEGTNFRLVMNKVRMEQAAKLLLESDLPIGKIAERLGYSDTSNFRHAFRMGMKISPSVYRATARR